MGLSVGERKAILVTKLWDESYLWVGAQAE